MSSQTRYQLAKHALTSIGVPLAHLYPVASCPLPFSCCVSYLVALALYPFHAAVFTLWRFAFCPFHAVFCALWHFALLLCWLCVDIKAAN